MERTSFYTIGSKLQRAAQFHAAIADWLHSLGFHTSRYYNKGGVDNGLKVTM